MLPKSTHNRAKYSVIRQCIFFTEFGKVSESDMVTNEANRRWGKAFLTEYVKDAENHGRHVTVTG